MLHACQSHAHSQWLRHAGRVVLKDVTTFNVTTTKAKTAVNTMNKLRRARGYRTATLAITWSITVPVRKGDPEVDWESIMLSDEEFLLTWERDDNGKTRQLVDCVVNEVGETEGEDGSAELTISGLALDNRAV